MTNQRLPELVRSREGYHGTTIDCYDCDEIDPILEQKEHEIERLRAECDALQAELDHTVASHAQGADEPESRTQIDRVEYPCGCVASFNGMILMTCAEHSPKGNK